MGWRKEGSSQEDQLHKFTSKLFADIEESPNSYSTNTNDLVAAVHFAWNEVQNGKLQNPELAEALSSPEAFVERFGPKKSKHQKGSLIRGLAHRVGIFMQTDRNDYGIEKISKKGRFSGKEPPQGDDWRKVDSDDWLDTYVRTDVLEEANNIPELDLTNTYFHATTSASLKGIGEKKALTSSKKIKNEGGEIKAGEVYGSNAIHTHVYVSPNKIIDSYGIPAWFDQFGVVFGISIDRQKNFLDQSGQEMGILSSSEGYEIGQEVPLENITIISAPSKHLNKVKDWARNNCPGIPVVSRESLQLKYGK